MEAITVVTPVFINVPERFSYFVNTINSFYSCCQYPGEIKHVVMDDRSPMLSNEVQRVCDERGLMYKNSNELNRKSFFDVYCALVQSVRTEYFIYLEPDHHFFLPYDFVTPALRLFELVPSLHQLYLRAPITYEPFKKEGDVLITRDNSVLFPLRIDSNNTGWIGKGKVHESFSLMPSIFKTKTIIRSVCDHLLIEGGPYELESVIAEEWEGKVFVAYLNSQAFCYHIGKEGKQGPGGALEIGDKRYEEVWSRPIRI